MTDYLEPGELGLFINESQVSFLEDVMRAQGFLDAKQMMSAFQMMRSNDLMAWNMDSTQMPARMHTEYLRQMFQNNDLAAGRYVVDGHPVSLAPLHQPHNLAGITAAHDLFPDALQVACFDTAFHRGHPWVNDTFALPHRLYDESIRRYRVHGLSYDDVTGVIASDFPELHSGRIIIAHPGNGASMCATRLGKSGGSSMGFSALDGLLMGTRCGQIDPGVILYLIDQKAMTPDEVPTLLYKESGLLGVSGISGDMRSLLASEAPEAWQAIEYYVFRARREIGALSAVLGGLDALIFCGGIGENAGMIRQRIVEGLGYPGLEIGGTDPQGSRDIGCGAVRILVIPTDEDRVIARAVHQAVAKGEHSKITGMKTLGQLFTYSPFC